jgi:predicted ATPase
MQPVSPAGALVGRDSEIALLTRLIRELGRGRGGSLLIEGEPGIGKSVLVQAAVEKAPEAGCQVFWGAGDELGQALPLLPFLDGLRVREPSANPRRDTIVRLLRGQGASGSCWTLLPRRRPGPGTAAFTGALEIYTSLGAAADAARLQANL